LAVVVTVAKGYDLAYIWKTQGEAAAGRTTGGYYINASPANWACAATYDTARPSSPRALTTTSLPPANRRPNTIETWCRWNSTPAGAPPR